MESSENTGFNEVEFASDVQEVLAGLPAPLQAFLKSPRRDEVSLNITKRYNLHLDQAGKFEKAYLFMLMGIFSPDQFVADLTEAGIPEETIRAIANDVNEEVFKPLRAEEREGSSRPEPVVTSPAPAPIQQAPAGASPAPPLSAKPITPEPPVNLPIQQSPSLVPGNLPPFPFPPAEKVVMPPQATQPPIQPAPPVATPAPLPTQPIVKPAEKPVPSPPSRPAFVPPSPAMPVEAASVSAPMRTMQSDMLAANEHRAALPKEFHPSSHPETPAPIQTPIPPPAPARAIPLTQTPSAAPPPIPVDYTSGDPYREPFN